MDDHGSYVDHPELSALPLDARQHIADQLNRDQWIGAIKTLREASGLGTLSLKEARDIIDAVRQSGSKRPPGAQIARAKLANGRIDKGTILTLYQDGTFTTTGMIITSHPDRLVGFSSDIDSMRRKAVTGRGAAFLATGGISILASNNRGVVYVTLIGARSGTKTYTTKNPDNGLLSSIRSLQAAADALLASPPPVASAPNRPQGKVTQASESPSDSNDSATPQDGDVATQLKMVAELHAAGALSDQEFAAAKARILS